MTTRRWRASLTVVERADTRARDRERRRVSTEANLRVRLRAYVHVYLRRWSLPRQACFGCSSPRALVYHPDLARGREFVWSCRACIAVPGRIAEIVADGALVVLGARPMRVADGPVPVAARAVPSDAAAPVSVTGALPAIAAVNERLLAAARGQVAMAARRGNVDVISLATYYVDLLEEEERTRLDLVGNAVDLRAWRPYGIDDLDHSVINLYFRRRQRAAARRSMASGTPS